MSVCQPSPATDRPHSMSGTPGPRRDRESADSPLGASPQPSPADVHATAVSAPPPGPLRTLYPGRDRRREPPQPLPTRQPTSAPLCRPTGGGGLVPNMTTLPQHNAVLDWTISTFLEFPMHTELLLPQRAATQRPQTVTRQVRNPRGGRSRFGLRAGVRLDVRVGIQLEPDPRTDPTFHPTTQVNPPVNTGRHAATDPCTGSAGGVERPMAVPADDD